MLTLRSDRGREYITASFQQWLNKHGIVHQTSIAKTPQQNGKAERLNAILLECTRCLLVQSDVPDRFWPYALHCANYLCNVRSNNRNYIPYSKFHGKSPDYSMLRTFGCKAYAWIHPTDRSSKIKPVSEEGMFIGYCDNSKGYEILMKDEEGIFKVIERVSVTFDESMIGVTKCFDTRVPAQDHDDGAGFDEMQVDDDDDNVDGDESSGEHEHMAVDAEDARRDGPFGDGRTENMTAARPRGRGKREPKRNIRLDDYYMYIAQVGDEQKEIFTLMADPDDFAGLSGHDPKSRREALAMPDGTKWHAAIDDEVAAIIANKTYTIVPRPKNKHVLPTRFVLRYKKNAIGQIEKRKARWVCQGFRQLPGVDYFETSSSVVRMSTARTLFAIAAMLDWDIRQIDINNAFLLGDLDEEIYVEQPEGYEQGDPAEYVCLLNKSLHGLKQAPLVWNRTVTRKLTELVFQVAFADPSTFHIKSADSKVFTIVYVDDFLIAGPNKEMNTKIKETILQHFKGKDLGA